MPDLGATSSHIKYNPGITAAAAATTAAARPPEKNTHSSYSHPIQKFNSLINICKMKIFQHVAKSYNPPLSGLYNISAQHDYVYCPVDPGSIQGSHWPISLTRKYI